MAFRQLSAIIITLLLLGTALGAMSLEQAEAALDSKNKSEIFRAYDTFKSAYMEAAISSDSRLKKRALSGIVKSGELLHIDVTAYSKKLRSVSVDTPKHETKQTAKQVEKTGNPAIRGQNHLRDVRWEQGNLVFHFEKQVDKKDINFFKLEKSKKKGYRYVFDIHGVLDKSHTLTHRDLKRISLSQYKPDTIRLVLESSEALPVSFSRKDKSLSIRAGISGVTSPKTVESGDRAAVRKKDKVIVIDPGHGGKDGGAVGHNRYKEKDIVLAFASKTAAILRDRGYTVHMTRSKDRFIKLRNRTHYANEKKADLFISVHANAVPKRNAMKAYGIETYFLSPSRSDRATNAAAQENKAEVEDMDFYGKNTFLNALNSEKIIASHKLAIDLQSSVLSSVRARYEKVKDGGVREGPFWVLVGAQMPAVLVEVGFISHPAEAVRLNDKTYQNYFARGLADGVERYFAKNP